MTREELLARLGGLRQARVGQVRVPHKPLLLLWLFGQVAATGSSAASYQQAEEPVSQLINDFGPPVASPAAARQRGAGEGREPPSVRMNRPADMGAAGQCGRLAGTGLAVTLGQGIVPQQRTKS